MTPIKCQKISIKIIQPIVVILAVLLGVFETAFITKKATDRNYGLLSMRIMNDSVYHYMVVDLEILDNHGINYGCDTDGYACEIRFNTSTVSINRRGKYKEIIEFDYDPGKVKVSGENSRFIWYQ